MKICVSTMLMVLLLAVSVIDLNAQQTQTITDAAGRQVTVPTEISRVICSGPGALRLLSYLGGQNRVVAVDDIEVRRNRFDARPYALANPQFKELPIFGEFRGFDNPELILALPRQPQVIFKTYATMGHDPVELQEKTGIPTVILEYGNLGTHRDRLVNSLRIMGRILGLDERSEMVIAFFEAAIDDLKTRTEGIPETERPTCFMGGIAFRGPHGFRSTEPGYPPFMFVNAANLAYDKTLLGSASRQITVAKEKLLQWDPEVLFLDLSTLQLEGEASGLWEIRNDPALQTLGAVQKRKVYGVLPYNWYTKNYGSVLANAYFIGKVLYPDRFKDVQTAAKADEIYEFLVGKPVFNQMNALFDHMAYKAVLE
ncbi:MAG: iron ABC transporter substrate-binding protein [Desulfobacterales bacterium]|jgi:iron complex transport system substrate-binding protein